MWQRGSPTQKNSIDSLSLSKLHLKIRPDCNSMENKWFHREGTKLGLLGPFSALRWFPHSLSKMPVPSARRTVPYPPQADAQKRLHGRAGWGQAGRATFCR